MSLHEVKAKFHPAVIASATVALPDLTMGRVFLLAIFARAVSQKILTDLSEQASLVADFDAAVASLKDNPRLIADFSVPECALVGHRFSQGLVEVAGNAPVLALRLQAIDALGVVSVSQIDRVRTLYDINYLVRFALQGDDPELRCHAVESLRNIGTSEFLRPLDRPTRDMFMDPLNIPVKSLICNGRDVSWNGDVTYLQYIVAVIAHVQKTDTDSSVREFAARQLDEIAATQGKEYQSLVAAYMERDDSSARGFRLAAPCLSS